MHPPSWLAPIHGWQRHTGRVDVALAVRVGGIACASASIVGHRQVGHRAPDAAAWTLLLVGSAALVLSRRYTVGVLLVTHATALLYVLGNYAKGPSFLAMLVACALAAWLDRPLTVWAVLAWASSAFRGCRWQWTSSQPQPARRWEDWQAGCWCGLLWRSSCTRASNVSFAPRRRTIAAAWKPSVCASRAN